MAIIKYSFIYKPEFRIRSSEKVRERIQAAEVFVAIFTRRDLIAENSYSTSPWVIEEKAAAISGGKKILLFVENGVSEIGGLQGDFEHIPFSRDNLAPALLSAIDYVLAITALPFQCKVQGTTVQFDIGGDRTPEQNLDDLRIASLRQPNNIPLRVELAKTLHQMGDRSAAITEIRKVIEKFPNAGDAHHELGHFLEEDTPSQAVIHFQRALDLNPATYRNYRCLGRCLNRHANLQADPIVKRATLEKSRRLLQRAALIGGEKMKQQIDADLFVVEESLAGLPPEP